MKEQVQRMLSNYYSEKLKLHGPNYRGADWGSLEAQQLSFEQLVKLLSAGKNSLLDYGCGYGALYDYLQEKNIPSGYTGYDLSPEMIHFAKQLHEGKDARWISELPEETFDFVIACGIFSIKLDVPVKDWEEHMLQTLHRLDALSAKGFAFNSLTSYSDAPLMKEHLYYPEPEFLFSYCKKHFSRYVSLLHDYPKYEFVIIVRKDDP